MYHSEQSGERIELMARCLALQNVNFTWSFCSSVGRGGRNTKSQPTLWIMAGRYGRELQVVDRNVRTRESTPIDGWRSALAEMQGSTSIRREGPEARGGAEL